jgi:putative hydrolase of the HAD superfamily
VIRAVLFDAVGTLIYPEPSVAAVYAAAGRRFGSRRTPAEIGARFRVALQRDERADRRAGQLGAGQLGAGRQAAGGWKTSAAGERERWRRIVGEVLDDAADAEALFEHLWNHFAQASSWRTFPDVPAAWRRLRQRGCRLGIASNFDDRLDRLCRQLDPLSDADVVCHSAGLGYAKPDPRFFGQAAHRLGLRPPQILFVGDDRRLDHDAARGAGFAALWLSRHPPHGSEGDVNWIASLDHIADHLRD